MASFKTQAEREEELLAEMEALGFEVLTPEQLADKAKQVYENAGVFPGGSPDYLDDVRNARTLSQAIAILQDGDATVPDHMKPYDAGDRSGIVNLLGATAFTGGELYVDWLIDGIPSKEAQRFPVLRKLAEDNPDEYIVDENTQTVYKWGRDGLQHEVDIDGNIVEGGRVGTPDPIDPSGRVDYGIGVAPETETGEVEVIPFLGGLPEYYTAPRVEERVHGTDNFYAGTTPGISSIIATTDVAPLYHVWDYALLFGGYSGPALAEVQTALVAAGLLKPGQFTPGFWDLNSQAAMEVAMVEANTSPTGGTTWQEVLQQRTEIRKEMTPEELAAEAGIGPRQIRPFTAPDYASLEESVKALFASRLGRTPQAHEMELLASEMSKNHRQQFNNQDAAARELYDQGNRQILFGEEPAGVTVQDVDPMARLGQTFSSLFGGEEERVADVGRSRQGAARVMSTLAGLEQQVGR